MIKSKLGENCRAAAGEKIGESSDSQRFLLWGPRVFVQNVKSEPHC